MNLMMIERLKQLWKMILDVDDLLIDECTNFFEEGGNSLLLSIMVAKIEEIFGISLSPQEVYVHSEFGAMSSYLQTCMI